MISTISRTMRSGFADNNGNGDNYRCTELIIRDNIEDSTIPDLLLAELKKHDGKIPTKPLVDKIMRACNLHELRVVNQYGIVRLSWGHPATGIEYHSIMIGTGKNLPAVNTAYIEEENPAWYKGLQQRNANRQSYLDDEGRTGVLAAIDNYAATIRNARAALEQLLDDMPDRHAIAKELGVE